MVVAFCSPDGRAFEIEESSLRQFAITNNLIDGPSHFSNVIALTTPGNGKKHLKQWQPVAKLRWLMLIDKTTGQFVSGRAPEPVLGNEQFFVNRGPHDTSTCDWQCTGRLWSSGFAAAAHSKPAGVA